MSANGTRISRGDPAPHGSSHSMDVILVALSFYCSFTVFHLLVDLLPHMCGGDLPATGTGIAAL
ncbi:hypothetical protein [Bradyrhizobium macuxiense]|uniref:hypothetical protein n=1 Tax=Bradyrhizobium macuxiense TaxID=1755647 RepID=UPI0010A96D59|nr:hypothetical protein [Bradyrhizobium macuxiense]